MESDLTIIPCFKLKWGEKVLLPIVPPWGLEVYLIPVSRSNTVYLHLWIVSQLLLIDRFGM